MNVLDLIRGIIGGPAANNLIEFLNGVARTKPDLAPKALELIAMLQTAASPGNLANVAQDVIRELGDIGQGKIKPHDHPSDA